MKFFGKRLTVLLVLCAFVFSVTGCGYIMHPERRTEKLSDQIDTTTVIYDCLWLIPGLVPGVIAILVDATNDTWYLTETELNCKETSEGPTKVGPGELLTVNLQGMAPMESTVSLHLMDSDGNSIANSEPVETETTEKVSLRVPKGLASDMVTLALFVNEHPQLTWDILIQK